MKKLWIVLLSAALIMAFAMPVCAADVKFSGSYVMQGYYDNNRALVKDGGASVSDTWQRLRIQTDFQIQEGLKLTTKFDALEKIWGAARNLTGTYYTTYTNVGVQNTGSGEAENIKFREAYVTANILGGALAVGYQQQNKWGTDFADYGDYGYGARIKYTYVMGPWTFLALYDKVEGTQYYAPGGPAANTAVGNTYQVDQQADKYSLAFIYNWGKGNGGLLLQYLTDATGQMTGINYNTSNPATDGSWKRQWYAFLPYVKAQFGPLYVEAEVVYLTGKTRKYEVNGGNPSATNTQAGPDRDKDGWSGYANITYDFAPMYAGFNFVYVAGDDPATLDKDEAGFPGATDFNPLLLLFNYDLGRWNGNLGSYGAAGATAGLSQQFGVSNATIGQIFVGMKPIPKLDIRASYAMARADQDGASRGWQDKNYGSELDITATYKIYDNLSYMVGFAYLWTGDWFKGTSPIAQVDNDYLVTHKLTLTF